MSSFRHRGVRTVVDTLQQAEFDFASHRIPAQVQERIAHQLKSVPRSTRDRVIGDLHIRQVEGWDVCFVIAPDGSSWAITIIGVETAGALESYLNLLMRAGKETLPPGVQRLIEGRKQQ